MLKRFRNTLGISSCALALLAGNAFAQDTEEPSAFDLYQQAQQSVAEGDLTIALSRLERALFLDPNSVFARLFYAAVLLRLDSLSEAERQISFLLEQDLTSAQRAEVERLEEIILQRQQSTLFFVDAGLGVKYSSNQNLVPDSDTIDFLGVQIRNVAVEAADVVFTSRATGGFRHDLGFSRQHYLTGRIGIQSENPIHERETDQQIMTASVAPVFDFDNVTLTPEFNFGSSIIDGELGIVQGAGSVEFGIAITPRISVQAGPTFGYRHFFESDAISEDELRSGYFYAGNGSVSVEVMDNLAAVAFAGVEREFADDYYRNWSVSYGGAVSWQATQELGFVGVLGLSNTFYDQADPLIDPNNFREEFQVNLRFEPSVDLSGLANRFGNVGLSDAISGLSFDPYVNYYDRNSNFDNYDFDDVEVGFELTYERVF